MLLRGLLALGVTTAEAGGIGVHLRVHAQNIPRAVAGGHSPPQLNPNTRSIQPG
jgi:hypothetical protein